MPASHCLDVMRIAAKGLPLLLLAVLPAWAQNAPLGWVADPRTGCRVWDAPLRPNETMSWSGACAETIAQGRGVLVWTTDGKQTSRYEGDVRDGKLNGRGVFTYPNGSCYTGEFRDNLRSGRGTMAFLNGNSYDGQWRDNERNGSGVYTWVTTGTRYDGEWRASKRHGRGITTYPTARYEGEYRDDLPNGNGVLTDGGDVYSGSWSNGCFQQGARKIALDVQYKDCGFK